MLSWITENLANIIIVVVLGIIIAANAVRIIRNKKKGKSSCSCGCTGCSMSESCSKKK